MTAPAPETLDAKSASPVQPTLPDTLRPRFTLDGDTGLEEHLARTCNRIVAGLRGLLPADKIEAVLLGGGYGRGEGGVWQTPDGDQPYNDLELYVFLRGNRHWNERWHGRAIHVLAEILTPQAGIEVEFRIASLAELATSPVTMFSYDLISGHRRLVGSDGVLDRCVHHLTADEIPLSEATRLLMNRASGLLFAAERLRRNSFTAAEADFVARNIAKAQLAAGDAVLTAHRLYHWSVRERHRRLERLARATPASWIDEVCRQHAAGADFKLHPFRNTAARETLRSLHGKICALVGDVWLWLETRRLGTTFECFRDYAGSPARKWPEANAPRNVLVNLKVFGPRQIASIQPLRHPRERVLNALTLLLWEPELFQSPELLQRVQRELQTTATDFSRVIDAYRAIWEQVN